MDKFFKFIVAKKPTPHLFYITDLSNGYYHNKHTWHMVKDSTTFNIIEYLKDGICVYSSLIFYNDLTKAKKKLRELNK